MASRVVSGPYDSEADTRPVTAPVYAAFDADPGAGKMAPHNLRMMLDATEAAEVVLGAYDRRILQWLAGFEPSACAVIAGLISRANLVLAGGQR